MKTCRKIDSSSNFVNDGMLNLTQTGKLEFRTARATQLGFKSEYWANGADPFFVNSQQALNENHCKLPNR